MKYIIYNNISGAISRKGSATGINAQHQEFSSDESILFGESCNQQLEYIDINDKKIIDRPLQTCTQDIDTILANNTEVSTFTGVEVGAEIFIDGVSQGVEDDDGIVEIAFDTVGTYAITFSLFPFLDKQFVINAN